MSSGHNGNKRKAFLKIERVNGYCPPVFRRPQMHIWEKACLTRELNKAKREIGDLRKACEYYKRRCDILETIILDHDPKLLPPRGCPQQEWFMREVYGKLEPEMASYGPDTFEQVVIKEIQENSSRAPQGRRWSQAVVMFCFAWMSLGPKSYHFARTFLTLPCPDTLYGRFTGVQEGWKSVLLEQSQIRKICDLFRRRNGIKGDALVDVGIGIDAMSMEPLSITCEGVPQLHNHVFAFMMLPLLPEYKPITLHLMTSPSGNAGTCVRSTINALKISLTDAKFKVHFIATDGDSGYSCFHENMFTWWHDAFKGKGLECALALLEGREMDDVIVSDLLHLLKNARARIINGNVTMNLDGMFSFNAQDMESVLHLGKSLCDRSSTGKMRDQYPLEIFTVENFMKLLMGGHVNMAFFVLPYSLWNLAVRSPDVAVQMRMDLLSFVMEIFSFHEECLTNLNQDVVSDHKRRDIPQYFCSLHHCRRVLNTLAITLMELRKSPTKLSLDRIGTHVLECQFGVIRMLCHYKHDWKRILRAFANSMLVTDIASLLGHDITVRARVNHGGVKISENSLGHVYFSTTTVNMREIYESVNVLLAQASGSQDFGYSLVERMVPNIADFVNLLCDLMITLDNCGGGTAKIWNASEISHATIISRLITFCKKPEILEQIAEEPQGTERASRDFVESQQFDGLFRAQEVPE